MVVSLVCLFGPLGKQPRSPPFRSHDHRADGGHGLAGSRRMFTVAAGNFERSDHLCMTMSLTKIGWL